MRAKLDLEGFNNVKIVVFRGLESEKIRILNTASDDIFEDGITYNPKLKKLNS